MDQERFRQAIELLSGTTQQEIAERLGCCTRLIRKICSGDGGVTQANADAIRKEVEDLAKRCREWLGGRG